MLVYSALADAQKRLTLTRTSSLRSIANCQISAGIEKKRRLMHEVVRVDEPGRSKTFKTFKTFTREELIELLEPPGAV